MPSQPLTLPARIASAAALALALLPTAAWATTSLREALDHAWARAVQARVAESRLSQADASASVATQWLAQAPSLGLSEKSDRFNANRGAREIELELALALWLPSQRSARVALAASDTGDAQAAIAAARLTLAGELRTALWNLAAAKDHAEAALQHLTSTERLEADVARRQRAGDLARTDLLLAQEETLAAKSSALEAQMRERQAFSQLRVLTGLDHMPSTAEEAPTPPTGAQHPRVALAQASVERAQSELVVIQRERHEPPALSLGLSESRDDFAAAPTRAVRIGLRLPLGSAPGNVPKIAGAHAAVLKAQAELHQAQTEVEADQQQAQSAWEAAQTLEQTTQLRASRAAERLALQHKAFALGELGLAEFLRARAAATQAQLDALRARHALGAARAQLNQAKGLLP